MKMNSYASKIAILVLFAFYLSSVSCKLHLTRKMTIKIMNGLPNNDPLKVRCQSGDKDLGMQTLYPGDAFEWKFRDNFFGKSLWFCHFYWGRYDRSFDVYNARHSYPLCLQHESTHGKTCYWMVKQDGFYSSTHVQEPNKIDEEHLGVLLAGWQPGDGPNYD